MGLKVSDAKDPKEGLNKQTVQMFESSKSKVLSKITYPLLSEHFGSTTEVGNFEEFYKSIKKWCHKFTLLCTSYCFYLAFAK